MAARKPGKVRGLILVAVLASLGAAALAAWPRGPRFVWYTSEPLVRNGATVRAQYLIPAGWERRGVETARLSTGSDLCMTWFGPRKRFTWLPATLRRAFSLDAAEEDGMSVVAGLATPSSESGKVTVSLRCEEHPLYDHVAAIVGDGWAQVSYGAVDRATFEATYRKICGSFRVVK